MTEPLEQVLQRGGFAADNSGMPEHPDLQVISGRLERGEIDSAQYLEQLMRFVAAETGCARAGLRLLIDTGEGRVLRCVAMFDSTLDRMVTAADILHPAGSLYLERLRRDGNVSAAQVLADPASAGPLREYLAAHGVVSLMDMSFSVNGVLFGAFTCEQVGAATEWGQRQLQALRKIASRASLTLMHVVNASVDTAPGALWETSTPNRLTTMPMPLDLPPA
ncbi:MAG: GAF domain-containing protein [Rhizobiales bacterium]|nr:GAF domain-containing protein [Rhizobacter sp.]